MHGFQARTFARSAAPIVVGLGLSLAPRPSGLDAGGWRYLALFTAVVVALILEPIPPSMVGLLGVLVATMLGCVAPEPLASIEWGLNGFSEPTVWLIFGALVFSMGYERTGLGRRIALLLVRLMGRSTLGLGYALMLADLAIAPFTPSNTGRSAGVIYPIVRGIPALYGSAPGLTSRRVGAYLLWTGFASSAVTSMVFLTALSPNLLALSLVRREIGMEISWSQWLVGALPVGGLLVVAVPLLAYVLYPPEVRSSREAPAWAAEELRAMGRPTGREVIMGLLVLGAFLLWVFAGRWLNATTVALAVVALMILTRVVSWDDVIGNRGAWDTLIYFATLLTLADGLNRVGVVAWFAKGVAGWLNGAPPLLSLVVLVAFFFVVHYLFASLTAHTTAVLPALLAAGVAIPGMPSRVYVLLLVYSIGLMGVLTPYATGPAPVYFGSGFIPRRDFWTLGLVFGLIFLATLLGVGLPYLLWLERVRPSAFVP
jgi:L-tartrate/succinate antiporter